MKSIIYIIDDNIVSEFATKMVLEQCGTEMDVRSFENPYQGLTALLNSLTTNKDIPDIVLLDLRMPEMNGWEFLERLGKVHHHHAFPGIYMVSNFNSSSVRKRVKQHKLLRGYIERPISRNEMERILVP